MFWKEKSLESMTQDEWESLCDRCGRCCLHKLEDEDDGQVYYTRVACKLLDIHSGQCSDYENRHLYVPSCTNLSSRRAEEFAWLPSSCAYRRLAQGKGLESWHPLCSGTQASVITADISIRDRVIAEDGIDLVDLEEHIIHWFD
jgi:uncharacterized cysteine cluster protein YcgN (CxxCxxCC family)